MDLTTHLNTARVSNFSDPFRSDKLDKITITIGKKLFSLTDEIECRAIVRFRSGDTSGYHNITDPDFETLLKKVKSFIDNL